MKVAPKPVKRVSKPVDPVGILRGPLAYITGRPEFKEPVKKLSINQLIRDNQLLIEQAAPPIHSLSPIFDERQRKSQSRSHRSASSALQNTKYRARTEIFEEADEEIVRRDLIPDDSASRRSASPVGSRHTRAAPSTR